MDGHRHEALSDEVLEKEIEAALGVDPSPEFLPRLRARIASGRVNESWVRPGLWRWAAAGMAVAAVAIVGLSVSDNSVPAPGEAQMASTPRVETSNPATGVAASSPESAAPTVVPAVREAPRRTHSGQARAEVLISPNEAVALRQLVVALAARNVEASDIPTLGGESAPLAPIEEIVLEPIE